MGKLVAKSSPATSAGPTVRWWWRGWTLQVRCAISSTRSSPSSQPPGCSPTFSTAWVSLARRGDAEERSRMTKRAARGMLTAMAGLLRSKAVTPRPPHSPTELLPSWKRSFAKSSCPTEIRAKSEERGKSSTRISYSPSRLNCPSKVRAPLVGRQACRWEHQRRTVLEPPMPTTTGLLFSWCNVMNNNKSGIDSKTNWTPEFDARVLIPLTHETRLLGRGHYWQNKTY